MFRTFLQSWANRLGYHISDLNSKTSQNAMLELQQLCSKWSNPIVMDVGAHHGQSANKFRSVLPGARIFSFEPFPESFAILKRNTSNDSAISCFNFGLSDRPGVCPFHANSSSATNSLLETDAAGARTWGKGLLETQSVISADFQTLDAVLHEIGVPQVNLLKLDVQGAEHLVMSGAAEACRANKVDLIYTEIITRPTYVGQRRFDEALALFWKFGFDLHGLYNLTLSPDRRLCQVDAIFERRCNANLPAPECGRDE